MTIAPPFRTTLLFRLTGLHWHELLHFGNFLKEWIQIRTNQNIRKICIPFVIFRCFLLKISLFRDNHVQDKHQPTKCLKTTATFYLFKSSGISQSRYFNLHTSQKLNCTPQSIWKSEFKHDRTKNLRELKKGTFCVERLGVNFALVQYLPIQMIRSFWR